jgi:protoporphyrinogen oxidase
MDEAMKRIPRQRLEAQIRFHKEANYTMIRNWVGQSTSEDFYDLEHFIGAHEALERFDLADKLFARVDRWMEAMPQYVLGHEARVRTIEERVAHLPRLALAGNAYHGVGIPDCVRSGEAAADALLTGG